MICSDFFNLSIILLRHNINTIAIRGSTGHRVECGTCVEAMDSGNFLCGAKVRASARTFVCFRAWVGCTEI